MQTEDIILWVDKAIEVREASYVKPKKEPFYFNDPDTMAYYDKRDVECLEETKPEEAKGYDWSIACMLIQYVMILLTGKKKLKKIEL